MTIHDYISLAMRTNNPQGLKQDLLHGIVGITTESGELADLVKRYVYYRADFKISDVIEELGDLLWYIALLMHTLDIDPTEVMEQNIAKLRVRYPDGFKDCDAILRADKKAQDDSD